MEGVLQQVHTPADLQDHVFLSYVNSKKVASDYQFIIFFMNTLKNFL